MGCNYADWFLSRRAGAIAHCLLLRLCAGLPYLFAAQVTEKVAGSISRSHNGFGRLCVGRRFVPACNSPRDGFVRVCVGRRLPFVPHCQRTPCIGCATKPIRRNDASTPNATPDAIPSQFWAVPGGSARLLTSRLTLSSTIPLNSMRETVTLIISSSNLIFRNIVSSNHKFIAIVYI